MAHSAARRRIDPTIYREEDEVGEYEVQTLILELLRPLVERWMRLRGRKVHVGSNQFMYWVRHDPTRSIAPDLYVLPGVPQPRVIGAWKVWEEHGVVPRFALEVVGREVEKDYVEAPQRYAELGVAEVVIFDPYRGQGRVAFQLFRRARGRLALVETTNADRVRSRELGCSLRRVGFGDASRLRIGRGRRGDDLLPTSEEAERAAREAERVAREAEEQALRRVAELEAEIDLLRRR